MIRLSSDYDSEIIADVAEKSEAGNDTDARVEVCSEGGEAHAMDYTAHPSQLISNHGH